MGDDRVYVHDVGSDDSGPFMAVRCGDRAVHIGQGLSLQSGEDSVVVTVERVSNYGHEFTVLHPGLTARVWARPGEAVSQFTRGTLLTVEPLASQNDGG